MEIKVLINVGDKIEFDELPDEFPFESMGIVSAISVENNLVLVVVPLANNKFLEFDLDGSRWSHCGNWKRDTAFIQ